MTSIYEHAPSPTTDPPAPRLAPTLTGREYTDPGVYSLEQQRIFEREWVCVGHASQNPRPGDVQRVEVGIESVIVVRGRDGELRAFLNVCRHRGARLCLTETASVGRAIRCPYHAWTYGLDGRLVAAPNWEAMPGLDRAERGLHPVQLEVAHGLVFVTLDDHAASLADSLAPQLDHRFGDAGTATLDRWGIGDLVVGATRSYDVAANWKLIQENFQECYHCGTIHPELVDQVPTFQSFEEMGEAGYHPEGYSFAPERDGFSLSGHPASDRLPGLREEDDRRYFGFVLRPGAFLSLLPDHVILHRFQPLAADRTRVVCDWLFAAHQVARDDFDPSDAVELFHRVNEQDFAAAQWCQPGMASRAYRDGGVLVPSEAAIIAEWYYAWYRRAMAVPGPRAGSGAGQGAHP